jgi:NAD(P)-dependent dehydrogenase (short-subunit alcohol dehydrogenase family)
MGANVVLIGRNEDRLIKTYKELTAGKHLWFAQDITEFDALEPIISESVSKIGKFSGFLHSAGIELSIPLISMHKKHYDKLYATNVISAFEISKILSKKKYVHPEGASFAFISSAYGKVGKPGLIGYCSSKFALIGGAKAMALELAPKKIRVNCILPGLIKTEMMEKAFMKLPKHIQQDYLEKHPLGFGNPEDIANLTVFLLSNASKWITGAEVVIDGGYCAQ